MAGDRLLALIGAFVVLAGGFAMAGLLVSLAVDYGWRRMRRVVAFGHLQRALREYRDRHPDKDLSVYGGDQ